VNRKSQRRLMWVQVIPCPNFFLVPVLYISSLNRAGHTLAAMPKCFVVRVVAAPAERALTSERIARLCIVILVQAPQESMSTLNQLRVRRLGQPAEVACWRCYNADNNTRQLAARVWPARSARRFASSSVNDGFLDPRLRPMRFRFNPYRACWDIAHRLDRHNTILLP